MIDVSGNSSAVEIDALENTVERITRERELCGLAAPGVFFFFCLVEGRLDYGYEKNLSHGLGLLDGLGKRTIVGVDRPRIRLYS